jgi:UDP-N-acetyl-D-galactosamine dehydrogenase
MANVNNTKICVIGLGYVGLPLASAFSKKYEVVGFDISQWRIDELSYGYDRTLSLSKEQVNKAINNGMRFSLDTKDIKDCNLYIVTVPTPIIKAIEPIGKVLKNDINVVFDIKSILKNSDGRL